MTFSLRAHRYFAVRAINAQLAWDCGVRERNGAIVWPTVDAQGLLSPRSRRLDEGSGPKVRGEYGRTLGVWWPKGRPTAPHDILVCEGESDGLAALTALTGGRTAVATIPGASFPALRLLTELQHAGANVVALAFDGDLAGGQATERIVATLAVNGIGARVIAIPDDQDLASILGAEPNPARWLRKALLAAEPRSVEMAALVAENRWLRDTCLHLADAA